VSRGVGNFVITRERCTWCILHCFIIGFCLFTWLQAPVFGQERIAVSGITEPIHDVTISASVAGTVSTVNFNEGAAVKKGDIIIELDKQLEELEVERRRIIWEGKAEINSAAAQVATLGSLLQGTTELYNSTGSVSKEELEKQELEYVLAVSEHQRIVNDEEREHLEYKMALEQVRKRTLRAPIQGVITELFLEIGENCEPDEPLIHIVDTSQCLFVCNVEERISRTLKTGQTVDLQIHAGTDSVARTGRIVFICPVVDQASGLQKVKVLFDNQDGRVQPGVAGTMLLDVI